MADSNSSSVSVVAIIAILVLVGIVLYFLFLRGGDAPDAELQIDVNTTWVQPEVPSSVL